MAFPFVVVGLALIASQDQGLEKQIVVIGSSDHSIESRVEAIKVMSAWAATNDTAVMMNAELILKSLEPMFDERRQITIELEKLAPAGPASEEALKRGSRTQADKYLKRKSALELRRRYSDDLIRPSMELVGRLGSVGILRMLKFLEPANEGGASILPFHFDVHIERCVFLELAEMQRESRQMNDKTRRALWDALLPQVVALPEFVPAFQQYDGLVYDRVTGAIRILTLYQCPANELVPRLVVILEGENRGNGWKRVSREVLVSLSRYGADGVDSVPALILALRTELAGTNVYDRERLLQAVSSIGPAASEALPLLREAMQSPVFRLHQKSVEAAILAVRKQ